jgi:hypothetical protein
VSLKRPADTRTAAAYSQASQLLIAAIGALVPAVYEPPGPDVKVAFKFLNQGCRRVEKKSPKLFEAKPFDRFVTVPHMIAVPVLA